MRVFLKMYNFLLNNVLLQVLGLNMKNYGDPLSNCNDNVENTVDTVNSSDETPLPEVSTLPQVN